MDNSFFAGLVQNISLLLVFSFLYEFNWIDSIHSKRLFPKIFSGIIIGAIGILLMNTTWTYSPGIVFDARSILLSISGLYLGTIPTLFAIIVTGLFRIFMGGDGVLMGICVIISSGILGIVLKLYLKKDSSIYSFIHLLVLGFTVHAVMLGCTKFLPSEKALTTFKAIAIPVTTIYPLGTALLGLLMNIHVRNWQNRKAKESLVESERRFSDMLKNIKMLSVIIDNKQNITFCNNYLLNITGYTSDEIIGKNWFNLFVTPEEKEKALKIIDNLLKDKIPLNYLESHIITKNKKKLYISWNNTILKDEKGNIIGIASIGENITEKRKAIEALKKSEDRFNTLFQLSPDAITLTRLDDRIIIEVNDSACKLTGYTRDELIGEPTLSPKFWNNEDELNEYAKLIATSNKVSNFEAQFKMKSGEIRTGLVSGEIIQIQEEFYIIGVIRDITLRKDAEKELQEKNIELKALNHQLTKSIHQLEELNAELKTAKEKAEESNRLKTVFLQNLSHEIRTPMNGILGFLSLLKNASNDIKERNQYIDLVNNSGERLLNTVNDIVEISKIETKLISPNKTSTDLSEIINHYYLFYLDKAEKKGLNFRISNTQDFQDKFIYTDKHLLDSIISNLINNAIKFTEKGTIELGGNINNDNVIFYVKDTGIGIPEDKLDIIFERFLQVEAGTSRSYEGTGLGLSISKAYAALLGGELWVESVVDKGSTFFLKLPYEQGQQETITKNLNSMTESNFNEKCTILLAEDDEISYLFRGQ